MSLSFNAVIMCLAFIGATVIGIIVGSVTLGLLCIFLPIIIVVCVTCCIFCGSKSRQPTTQQVIGEATHTSPAVRMQEVNNTTAAAYPSVPYPPPPEFAAQPSPPYPNQGTVAVAHLPSQNQRAEENDYAPYPQ